MERYLSLAALANSAVCSATMIITLTLLRGGKLRHQLRALRLLSGYLISTLLLNVYLVGIVRSDETVAALLISMASVLLMWVLVYRLWARGE